jgi:hypothetical protein
MKHFVAMLHDYRYENSFVTFLAESLQTETVRKASKILRIMIYNLTQKLDIIMLFTPNALIP